MTNESRYLGGPGPGVREGATARVSGWAARASVCGWAARASVCCCAPAPCGDEMGGRDREGGPATSTATGEERAAAGRGREPL